MVLCIESMGEILKCDYSNESSEAVLSCDVLHHAREGVNLIAVNCYYLMKVSGGHAKTCLN